MSFKMLSDVLKWCLLKLKCFFVFCIPESCPACCVCSLGGLQNMFGGFSSVLNVMPPITVVAVSKFPLPSSNAPAPSHSYVDTKHIHSLNFMNRVWLTNILTWFLTWLTSKSQIFYEHQRERCRGSKLISAHFLCPIYRRMYVFLYFSYLTLVKNVFMSFFFYPFQTFSV